MARVVTNPCFDHYRAQYSQALRSRIPTCPNIRQRCISSNITPGIISFVTFWLEKETKQPNLQSKHNQSPFLTHSHRHRHLTPRLASPRLNSRHHLVSSRIVSFCHFHHHNRIITLCVGQSDRRLVMSRRGGGLELLLGLGLGLGLELLLRLGLRLLLLGRAGLRRHQNLGTS
jgi:hypothetical protein